MESDIKIFVRFLKDENIYNMFQTEAIRQCIFGTLHSYIMGGRKNDIYEATHSILAFSKNPLSSMIVWRETRKGIEFWRSKRDKLENLLRKSLKKTYLKYSQPY